MPRFQIFGDKRMEESIQPRLPLRQWVDLSLEERRAAFQYLKNAGWVKSYCPEILSAIDHLNHNFLRLLPGKNLHAIAPSRNWARGDDENKPKRMGAALKDFETIWNTADSDALFFRMLSVVAKGHIGGYEYREAEKESDEVKRQEHVDEAFKKVDRLSSCLNHIFEQFCVNAVVTRNGIAPRQDEKIIEEIYSPTLKVLSDPRWEPVSTDILEMFEEYAQRNFSEAITKGHRAIQRFLQILVGEQGKNSRGEIGELFLELRNKGIIPRNTFTEKLMTALQGYIASERAINSTAKPSMKPATAGDALLMMNVVMILIQYCLNREKGTR